MRCPQPFLPQLVVDGITQLIDGAVVILMAEEELSPRPRASTVEAHSETGEWTELRQDLSWRGEGGGAGAVPAGVSQTTKHR